MSDINWESVWKSVLNSAKLFPTKQLNDKSFSVSCPTRFSNVGKFSINITPSFNDNSISFEILSFNDNVSISDLNERNKQQNDFNSLSKDLTKWELSNRILDRFEILSDGFNNEKDAVNAVIDYINNKATESGRMFDDTLDSLNDQMITTSESIANYRRSIFRTFESIVRKHYRWHTSKNESFSDSVASFFDRNGNLAAVVTIVDDELIIDLAKHITSKISLMQSDEEIESEIVDDIDTAKEIMQNDEVQQLEDAVSANRELEHHSRYNTLERRIIKLENLYIKHRLHSIH